MGKKSEERAKRKAQKQERFEEAKASFVQKVSESLQPKYISNPDIPKVPHVASQINQAASSTPKTIKDGGWRRSEGYVGAATSDKARVKTRSDR